MKNIPKDLLNKLTTFVIRLGTKALDGITYELTFKTDRELNNEYMEIREEVKKAGFGENDIFRMYELSNGYIWDMDLSVVKHIVVMLSKVAAQTNNTPVGDLIGSSPEERRKSDMTKLAKRCITHAKKGENVFEVGLFSRNSVPRITATGKDAKTGKPVVVTYDAYAIRHWDLEEINASLLSKEGIKIAKIEPCDVLAKKTGVRFIIHLGKM